MSNVTGAVRVEANGQEYQLWLSFSGLAVLQERHGQDVLQRLAPPEDAPKNWMPELAIVRDLVIEALQRYHEEEADRWLADDILAAQPDILERLVSGSFPDSSESKGSAPSGNRKRPKRTA